MHKEYEGARLARLQENKAKLQALNISTILEDMALQRSKTRRPRTAQKSVQNDLIIGRDSLRTRAATSQVQNDDMLANDIGENNQVPQEVNQDTNQGKTRKFTRKENLWARANESLPLIKIQWNGMSQPVGEGSKDLPGLITTLIRTKQFPLNYADWRDVPFVHKDKIIKAVSAIYDMDDRLKSHVLLAAAKKFRAFKADLKQARFDEKLSYEENIDRRDPRVDIEEWKWLVNHWISEEAEERSKRGKHNRSKVISPHTTGSKSFARARHEWAKKLGYELTRHDFFLKSHTTKKGVVLDKALSRVAELEKAIRLNPELVDKSVEEGDLFSHVFGREPRGYVRGVGLGPTPSSLGIDGYRKFTSTKVQMANRECENTKEENVLLKSALQKIYDELQDLKEAMAGGGDDVRLEDVADHVSIPTPEHGSNPVPVMARGVANEESDNEFNEEAINSPNVEVFMPVRGRAQFQRRRHEGGGKEVILLSVERPRDRYVAKGTLQSTNPESRVGGSLLGTEYYEVVVHTVMRADHVLPWQNGNLKTLGDCVGHSIAWPHLNITNEERGPRQSNFQRPRLGADPDR